MAGTWLVILAMWAAGAQTVEAPQKRFAPAENVRPQYGVDWPALGETSPPAGWGVYVIANGGILDVPSGGWAGDPIIKPGEIEAGLGWRQPDMAMTFGYAQPVYSQPNRGWLDAFDRQSLRRSGPEFDLQPRSVLGFSLTFPLQQ